MCNYVLWCCLSDLVPEPAIQTEEKIHVVPVLNCRSCWLFTSRSFCFRQENLSWHLAWQRACDNVSWLRDLCFVSIRSEFQQREFWREFCENRVCISVSCGISTTSAVTSFWCRQRLSISSTACNMHYGFHPFTGCCHSHLSVLRILSAVALFSTIWLCII